MPRNSWSNSKADDTLDLELTADQNRLLFRALVSSYTDFTKIRIMVFRDLHDPLDGIPPNLDKESGVMALLQWAKAEGRLRALSDAVLADKPDTPGVQEYNSALTGKPFPTQPRPSQTSVNVAPPSTDPSLSVRTKIMAVAAILVAAIVALNIAGILPFTSPLSKPTTANDPPPLNPQSRVNPIDGLAYVYIQPGRFRMGCSPDDKQCANNESPQHEVQITRGFWLGQTEVTNEAFGRFNKSNGSAQHGQLPRAGVTWDDAKRFCEWSGGGLPTEAQWEYAARAGTSEPRYGPLGAVAWYVDNSDRFPHPVKQMKPNAWQLYDMLGNVWEWTQDWYQPTYLAAEPQVDPQGPLTGKIRVLRGGAWDSEPFSARASFRNGDVPAARDNFIGFRCRAEGKAP